jgi:hypothetical protein
LNRPRATTAICTRILLAPVNSDRAHHSEAPKCDVRHALANQRPDPATPGKTRGFRRLRIHLKFIEGRGSGISWRGLERPTKPMRFAMVTSSLARIR